MRFRTPSKLTDRDVVRLVEESPAGRALLAERERELVDRRQRLVEERGALLASSGKVVRELSARLATAQEGAQKALSAHQAAAAHVQRASAAHRAAGNAAARQQREIEEQLEELAPPEIAEFVAECRGQRERLGDFPLRDRGDWEKRDALGMALMEAIDLAGDAAFEPDVDKRLREIRAGIPEIPQEAPRGAVA